jgi:hypothetical protein
MTPEKADSFIAAFKSRSVKFTSTVDIPGLHYSEHHLLFRDSSGEIGGSGLTVDPIIGAENISKALGTDNVIISSNMGYREKGETAGLIISW